MSADHDRLSEEELAGMRQWDAAYPPGPVVGDLSRAHRRRLLAHEAALKADLKTTCETADVLRVQRDILRAELVTANELIAIIRKERDETMREREDFRVCLDTVKAERDEWKEAVDEACRRLGLGSLLLQLEPTATGASAAGCPHGSSGACQQCDLADLPSFAAAPATGAAPATLKRPRRYQVGDRVKQIGRPSDVSFGTLGTIERFSELGEDLYAVNWDGIGLRWWPPHCFDLVTTGAAPPEAKGGPSRPHLIDGTFQSDKYPSTPRGKVPLSVKDVTAQDLLWQYAQRRRAVDAEFSADLETALRNAGYDPEAKP